jgi:hypothetical protein
MLTENELNALDQDSKEMLRECYEAGFTNARLEMLGGGVMGVWIDLKDTYYALITSDFGLGVYDSATYAETGAALEVYDFDFDEDGNLIIEELWSQTANALAWLKNRAYVKKAN